MQSCRGRMCASTLSFTKSTRNGEEQGQEAKAGGSATDRHGALVSGCVELRAGSPLGPKTGLENRVHTTITPAL